jgi:hypothetical protein
MALRYNIYIYSARDEELDRTKRTEPTVVILIVLFRRLSALGSRLSGRVEIGDAAAGTTAKEKDRCLLASVGVHSTHIKLLCNTHSILTVNICRCDGFCSTTSYRREGN